MHNSKKTALIEKFVRRSEEYCITLPGSKSLSLRAVFLAALANGMSIIYGMADCDDTSEMISALEILGCRVEKDGTRHLVYGTGGKFREGRLKIEMKFSGTSTPLSYRIWRLCRENFCLTRYFWHMRLNPVANANLPSYARPFSKANWRREPCTPLTRTRHETGLVAEKKLWFNPA